MCLQLLSVGCSEFPRLPSVSVCFVKQFAAPLCVGSYLLSRSAGNGLCHSKPSNGSRQAKAQGPISEEDSIHEATPHFPVRGAPCRLCDWSSSRHYSRFPIYTWDRQWRSHLTATV